MIELLCISIDTMGVSGSYETIAADMCEHMNPVKRSVPSFRFSCDCRASRYFYMSPPFVVKKAGVSKILKNIIKNLGVLPFPYVYKSVYEKKEDDTYAKFKGKGVSDFLSQ